MTKQACVVVYYCRTYVKAVRGGGSEERGSVLWDATSRRRACVDESDHHALMYVWHGQTVSLREESVTLEGVTRPLLASAKRGGRSRGEIDQNVL